MVPLPPSKSALPPRPGQAQESAKYASLSQTDAFVWKTVNKKLIRAVYTQLKKVEGLEKAN
tara:strand:- start:323 stop:505 length:183 start_codon:yes stop_codon:yes gene_type:complete